MAPRWTTPKHVGRGRPELPVHLVQRAWRLLVSDRRPVRLASDNALNAHLLHQPSHRAPGDVEAFAAHLVPDLACAVDAPVVFEDTPDLGSQRLIPARALGKPRGVGALGQKIIVGGRGDRQDVADRLDPVRITMRVDERHHHFGRRSSSAIAKYADALRRISLAWRSSRFSRSNAFILSAISLGTPGRRPLSTSAFLTHSRSVCGVQPIFAAIETIGLLPVPWTPG
jgi:hypothetical protein